MTILIRRLLILVFLCSASGTFGQTYIKGRIKDQLQNLRSASVFLLNSDSILVKTVLTDTSGVFVFENLTPGHYLVSSSAVGYSKYVSQVISVEEKNIVLPDIVLEKLITELGEVVVKTKKPLYEQKIDRLILNVQSSITSSGNTILEVLQKSPGIVVNKQNNSIMMNGKSGVRVMINDKYVQLPLDAVVQMLDGMSASNVEKIELITTPPSKFDAEGNAGIIHIIMKGNSTLGTNGSFGITLGFRWAETFGGNFNLNHRGKNFAFFLDYSIVRNHNQHILKFERQSAHNGFVQTVTDNSQRENITTQQNLNAGFEWKLSSNTTLNLSVTGYRRNWTLTAVNLDNYHISPDSTVTTHMNIDESNIWQSATAGIGLETKINSKSELKFNLDFLYYHNNNPSNYNDTSFFKQGNNYNVSKIDLKKSTPIRFLVATIDYQYHFTPKLTIEAGLKGVTSNLENNVLVQRFENNVWMIDPVFTSFSKLHEQVGAAYMSTKWNFGKQWQVNGGLRLEYTHTDIGSADQQNLLNRKYVYLFPSLFIRKDMDEQKSIQFAYTRRITRPTYNDIAPFVFFWGPNSFSSGNTALLPAISDAIQMGYQLKKWIISLQFSHTKNEITAWQPEIDASNNLTYRSQNLDYLNTIGFNNSLSINMTRWWQVHTNITGQYQVAQAKEAQNNVSFHWFGLNIEMINTLKLPKDFSVEISGTYQTRTFSGIAEYLPTGSLNAGIQKKMGAIGTFRLSMDDILNSNYWRIKTRITDKNQNTYFNYNFHNQYIRLTYTRNFGNTKLQSVNRKSGATEERGRVSN